MAITIVMAIFLSQPKYESDIICS